MDLKDIGLYVDDRAAEGVSRVHREVYSDPELFGLEQKFIFEHTWNFLGLESQLPRVYDFLTTWNGRTPVLVTRGAHDQSAGRALAYLLREPGGAGGSYRAHPLGEIARVHADAAHRAHSGDGAAAGG